VISLLDGRVLVARWVVSVEYSQSGIVVDDLVLVRKLCSAVPNRLDLGIPPRLKNSCWLVRVDFCRSPAASLSIPGVATLRIK